MSPKEDLVSVHIFSSSIVKYIREMDFLSNTETKEFYDGTTISMRNPRAFYFYRKMISIHWFHNIGWEEKTFMHPSHNVSAGTIWKWYDVDNLSEIGFEEAKQEPFSSLVCSKRIYFKNINKDNDSWNLTIPIPGVLVRRDTIKNQLACVADSYRIMVGVSTGSNDLEICSMQYDCKCLLHVSMDLAEQQSSYHMYWCDDHKDNPHFVITKDSSKHKFLISAIGCETEMEHEDIKSINNFIEISNVGLPVSKRLNKLSTTSVRRSRSSAAIDAYVYQSSVEVYNKMTLVGEGIKGKAADLGVKTVTGVRNILNYVGNVTGGKVDISVGTGINVITNLANKESRDEMKNYTSVPCFLPLTAEAIADLFLFFADESSEKYYDIENTLGVENKKMTPSQLLYKHKEAFSKAYQEICYEGFVLTMPDLEKLMMETHPIPDQIMIELGV